MIPPERRDSREGFLPRDATPCIWMSAGLVAYKLCDRELDCEGCPFDAAMRGVQAGPPETPAMVAEGLAPWAFPVDRRYHPGHTWVLLGEDDGPVRLGLDVFAARLLRHGSTVILPEEDTHLRQGQVAGWVVDETVPIPFRAGLSGRVLRRNPAALAHPALLAASPYDDGWLLEIAADHLPGELRSLTSWEAMRDRTARQVEALCRKATRLMEAGDEIVGTTLQDGGELLLDLRRVLGAARFRRLIRPFLS